MLGNTYLFSGVMAKTEWLRERQELLSQNIANADTPKYVAKDLNEVNFAKIMENRGVGKEMRATNPAHFKKSNPFSVDTFSASLQKHPFESSIDKNGVVLEEQAAKMNETQVQHNLMISLYKSNMQMFKTALE